jgi:hypothetical protein
MTDLIHRPKQIDAGLLEPGNGPRRFLTITVAIMAVVLIGLGAWVVYDQTTVPETTVTEEIQIVIDDYLATWNSYDGEAFLELVTIDYALDMTGGSVSITQQAEETYELVNSLQAREWNETVIGEPIMTGDGPWFVSLVEHFTAPGYGPQGADGVSTFTIVDEDGTLKVARHTYVGNN